MIKNNRRKFRRGDYVTDGDGDYYYVIGTEIHPKYGQLLEIEDVHTGNGYDMCEFRFYRKCRRPLSYRQEVNKESEDCPSSRLCLWNTVVDADVLRKFEKRVIAILRRHGNSIHIQ